MPISQNRLDELKNIKDKDIDFSDSPELDENFFENADLHMPEPKQAIYIRLDGDVIDWFKSHGKGYQTKINHVLRSYYEAQQTNAHK